jgi:predicted transcriptional regulator
MSTNATVDRLPTVDMSNVTTVDINKATTVKDDDHFLAGPDNRCGYYAESTMAETEVTTVVQSDMSTVVPLFVSTAGEPHKTTVDMSDKSEEMRQADGITRADTNRLTTVDELNMATVARFDHPELPRRSLSALSVPTVDRHIETTVVGGDEPTVVTSDRVADLEDESMTGSARSQSARIAQSRPSLTTVDRSNRELGLGGEHNRRTIPYQRELNLWVTEDGDLLSQSRVRRIRIAQDVVNSAEEAVYDTLWNTKTAQSAAESGDSSRIVQAGYDYLMKRTRLSKKTIQRVIDRLIHKDFIAIEKPADIYRRIPTVYRVFDYRTILAHHLRRGRTHVAKIGPGFTYACPMDDPRHVPIDAANMTTVDRAYRSTVDPDDLATEAPAIPVAGDKENKTTVVRQTTRFIDKNLLDKPASASRPGASSEAALATTAPAEFISGLQEIVQFVDTEAATLLWNECRLRVADCRAEEVLYFAQGKASVCVGGRIKNPVGFLLATVPKCFEGPAFANFRREEQRKVEEEQKRRHSEKERLRQIQEQGREEAEAIELGKRRLEAMSAAEYQAIYEKTKSEFLARYPNALRSAPKTIEDLVQQEMIRGLQN